MDTRNAVNIEVASTDDSKVFQSMAECQTRSVNMASVIRNMPFYDSDVPYQRDRCWEDKAKIQLLVSIFNGLAIPSMHLVKINKEKNSLKRNVIDGKQRLDAIDCFVKNKIKIVVEYVPDNTVDGNVRLIVPIKENPNLKHKSLTYKQLTDYACNSSNPQSPLTNQYLALYNHFMDYDKIYITEYEPMSIPDQIRIFKLINYSSRFNTEEHIYCPNFASKEFLMVARTSYFCSDLLNHVNNAQIKNNKRFIGLRFIHNVLYGVYGKDLQSFTGNVCPLGKNRITASAIHLHECFFNNDLISTDRFTEEKLKQFNLLKPLKTIKKLSRILNDLLNYRQSLAKKLDGNILRDLLIFTLLRIENKKLTISYIEENMDTFYTFICKYHEVITTKGKEGGISSQSETKKTLVIRYKIYEEIYKQCGLIDVAEKAPTSSDITTALLNSDGKCPITGGSLTDKNVRQDHVFCDKKSNDKEIISVSDRGNRIKNDLTSKSLEKIAQYLQPNQNQMELNFDEI